MKARFRGLRFVAMVSKGIGWLVLIAGLALGALIAQGFMRLPLAPFAEPYSTNSLVQGTAVFLPFLLGFLLLFGAGGVLQVLIAIEQNTRTAPGEAYPGPPDEAGQPWEDNVEQTP